MRRREFIALVGGAVLGHPLDALAQPDGRLRRVSFLTAASSSVFSSLYAAFVQSMHVITRWPAAKSAAVCFSQASPFSGQPWISTTGEPEP